MASLVQIAEPEISLCTNIAEAHIGFFSSKESIAEEKEEIYKSPKGGTFNTAQVFNLDDPYTLKMYQSLKMAFPKVSRWTFSIDKGKKSDICFHLDKMDLSGLFFSGHICGVERKNIFVPLLFGYHNLYNLMGSVGLAMATTDVQPSQIWEVLPQCSLPWGRSEVMSLSSGAKLIFDGYNANPTSTMALIDSIESVKWPGKKMAILGEMMELGQEVSGYYRSIFKALLRNQYQWVWFIAPSFEKTASFARDSGAF